ncbi:MAG: glutamine-hydrolyzing GMP synthase [Planctomycetota bacterium]|nr:MAG: glutamine-hydrolyzing GMP synthase [Planctomycetota bacterium]
MHQTAVVLDFGSQVTQLIARRVRECGVFCEILPCTAPLERILQSSPVGVILSGGPDSVYAPGAPTVDRGLFAADIPILGICYGMQLTAYLNGGQVAAAAEREYGRTSMTVVAEDPLFANLPPEQTVWMSHGDRIEEIPGAEVVARSANCPLAAVRIPAIRFHGVQFHPEVVHTEHGAAIIRNWLFNVAGCRGDWQMGSFIDEEIKAIRQAVGDDHVILGLSGGVDSSVAAVLLAKAIGKQLHCVFVNNGVLRKHEAEDVQAMFAEHVGTDLVYVDASQRFLDKLAGVADPEQKRKIIGAEFVAVFKDVAEDIKARHAATGAEVKFLAQGTLYPDVIESQSVYGGPASVIKSHHNVGGLPKDLGLGLVEPFRFLFKDEVRRIGEELGLPDSVVWRQPFPGPGLAVRILGDITAEKVRVLQEADWIMRQELEKAGLMREIWQSLVVLTPIKTVGVMGDERTYENVAAIRAITSTDGMTADWFRMPYEVLDIMANRIINEVRGINRVVYDISSKPPATIEWE